MGFFDFLKQKELKQIASLNSDLERLKKDNESLSRFRHIRDLSLEIEKMKADIDSQKAMAMSEIAAERVKLEEHINAVRQDISTLETMKVEYETKIREMERQIIQLDDAVLLQEYGMYQPIYDFANSDLYKAELESIREQQKQMIKNKSAATCSREWTVDGSRAKGKAMTEKNIKQIIRCFNDECDVLISKVKFNNVEAFKAKIESSAEALNKLNTNNAVSISRRYVYLKIKELNLAYEYALKKQEEKEEQKRIREQMREEARLQKEIEETRKDITKEQNHYANALDKISKQLESCTDSERELLVEKKNDIEKHLAELDAAIKDIDYREANKRAGYVYIISNIGSFGENIYKIGMTRRLDPTERVDELGDASVPFDFDIHAMIFSDDAPSLETALHHAFENRKVNMVNGRREFFNVTLDEIEAVVKANYDKTVEFVRLPNAEQYRETIRIKEAANHEHTTPADSSI